jgi:hypothetical protein
MRIGGFLLAYDALQVRMFSAVLPTRLPAHTGTERPAHASSTSAVSPFGPTPTTSASYAPRSVTTSVADPGMPCDPRRSSGSPAS